MSALDGYPDDMADHLTDDEAERLLAGGPADAAPALTGFVAGVRELGHEPIDATLAAAQVAAAAGSVGDRGPGPIGDRPRRAFGLPRPAFAVGLALLVVVGLGGLATVAHASAPGDPLYGLDRALEAVGIGDGGLPERAAEAAEIADADLGLAMETALVGLDESSELGESDRAEAVAALTAAAAALETRQAPVKDEVAALLRALADGDGQVSEFARDIRQAIELPEPATDPGTGPGDGSPSDRAPGTDRGQAPSEPGTDPGEPPSDRGPSDTGRENGRVPDEVPADGGNPPGRTPSTP